ncbi:hypothetical protein HPP92_020389 [Vanilla planifolia]|uniref:RRM domain-containing protein n=1 Tax=Vanilla planifolia TaxID=51239 RepID=A0A835UKR3_VANPL|nr:hypothetical protein HPP92_020389 [Vanilla planifolia]
MESDTGKLFIGGISWETTEDRLRQYFKKFGEVMEVMIMKDRITGRGRGFGFLVFADSTVAERVITEKHLIDGRMVEAKKAVPKDYQHILNNRNNISSVQGSPCPGQTKKIFVGGLASTVTDAEFKRYFEQFGSITDVVVIYDHNTQKPRGFGFITFDVEDAVDKVLHKTFHELNGKMVEVKRAVPRELSPGPNMRLPTGAYNYALSRINGFLGGYSPTQGYNPSSIKGYGMRVDGRFGPLGSGGKGLPSFDPGYGVGMDFEPGLSPIYNGNSDFNGTVDYAWNLSPYHIGNSGRFGNPIGYGGISGSGSTFNTTTHNLWGNANLHCTMNPTGSNANMTPGSGSLAGFGNSDHNWGATSSSLAVHGLGSGSNFIFGNPNHGSDFYGGGSVYKDPTWQPVSSEFDGPSTFGYGLGLLQSNVSTKIDSTGYIGAYNVSNRQVNKGKKYLPLIRFQFSRKTLWWHILFLVTIQ